MIRATRARGHYALTSRHERWVVASGVVLAASGALWLLGHYLLARPDEFGAIVHPFEGWALKFHGAASMVFLVVLGSVLPVHARRAWHAKRNRRTGATVLSVAAFLLVTGYGLYYSGSESLRPWISVGHWAIGLIGVPLLVLHATLGRRAAARLKGRRGGPHHHPPRPPPR